MDQAESLVEKIRTLAAEAASGHGVYLYDVDLRGRGRGSVLRVMIDREGGVSLDECAEFSRDFEALLDVEDLMKSRYTIEVSSPGMDRPLKTPEHYALSMGKLVRVVLAPEAQVEGEGFVIGMLRAAGAEGIEIELEGGDIRRVAYADIRKARQEVEI